ncbi:MAG: helix-turn-helix transcriptional regulator [Lachnospira sp.]
MEESSMDKVGRVLDLYQRLMDGEIVKKSQAAKMYGVSERSIQRDIEDINNYLSMETGRSGVLNSVISDNRKNGYRLEQYYNMKLTNSEILAICKILLDSRAFTKEEMTSMLSRLIDCCVPKESKKLVQDLISNEEFHYVELTHKSVFIDKMWDIGQAIHQSRYIEMEYHRTKDNALVKRKVKPAAIMFSEYYFYLTAFIEDDELKEYFDVANDMFPTIYRIDRIEKYKVLEEHFKIPYEDRFKEGEFRKRVQFMYGGKLQKVKFKYKGSCVEAVLDRLPTAKILDEEDGVYTISAEVFGKGIYMWLRSQGDMIEML